MFGSGLSISAAQKILYNALREEDQDFKERQPERRKGQERAREKVRGRIGAGWHCSGKTQLVIVGLGLNKENKSHQNTVLYKRPQSKSKNTPKHLLSFSLVFTFWFSFWCKNLSAFSAFIHQPFGKRFFLSGKQTSSILHICSNEFAFPLNGPVKSMTGFLMHYNSTWISEGI